MAKNIIHIEVYQIDENFCGSWEDGQNGAVLVTADTFQRFKSGMAESIRLHIQECVEDGDVFPDYLMRGEYDIEYSLCE